MGEPAMLAKIITEVLLWVLLEFTGYGQLADIGEFLLVDSQATLCYNGGIETLWE